MTIAASHPTWIIRPLRSSERDQALMFLDREHELNIYLISRICEAGLEQFGPVVAVFRNASMVAVATTSANLSAAVDPGLSAEELTEVAALISREVIARSTYLRAIIAPSDVVDALWSQMESHFHPPSVVRLFQPVYLLERLVGDIGLRHVRHGRTDDLDLLVPACAAMHHEEIGIDPLERDAFGYHQRIRDLVDQNRSFVWMEGSEIAFKCEISAETEGAVQLMGVWTAPRLRRQGYALRGLSEVCGHVLSRGRSVTLFVNDFNDPARKLYKKLGFRQIGQNRALIW